MKFNNLKIYKRVVPILLAGAFAITGSLSIKEKLDEKNGYSSYSSTTTTTQNNYIESNRTESKKENYPAEPNDEYSDDENEDINEETIEYKYNTEPDETLEEYQYILESDISYDSDFDNLLVSIDNVEANYPYSEYYEQDTLLDKYSTIKVTETNAPVSIIKNNRVDRDKLGERVEVNSMDSQITKNIISTICEILADNIDYMLDNNQYIDIDILNENLYNLKIESASSFSYAYYSPQTNSLGINLQAIDSLITKNPDENVIKRVIEHETNHILQASTKKNGDVNGYKELFGPCIKFNNTDVNSMYWEWYIESSAEQMTIDKNGYETSLTYDEQLQALEFFKVGTVLNYNNKATDLENISVSKDINDLYDYFDCKTDKQKKEVTEMFYAMNIDSYEAFSTTSHDFYEKFYEKEGYALQDEEKHMFRRENYNTIIISQTKMFYKNLINNISKKDMTLEEIFHLISIEENAISRYTLYYITGTPDIYSKSLDQYSYIQSKFFEELSEQLNISALDLQNLYNSYYKINHSNINFMNADQNKFYNDMEDKMQESKTYSINEFYGNNYTNVK